MDLTLEYGSILALKILTGTKTRAILNNTDNKCLKNEEKTFSSSYPPRNSNRGHLDWKPDKIRVFQSLLYLCDVNMMLKMEPATFPTPEWMRLKCGRIHSWNP